MFCDISERLIQQKLVVKKHCNSSINQHNDSSKKRKSRAIEKKARKNKIKYVSLQRKHNFLQ